MKARNYLHILTLLVLLVPLRGPLRGQTNEPPARVAIISETDELLAVADLLTMELSAKPQLQVLEREQIGKVYREQALSAANRDYVKLGQLLGADGLLIAGKVREGTNDFLTVRLVAVTPGLILIAVRFAWPLENLSQWAAGMSAQLMPQLPKLKVPGTEAIPLSFVSLRSAVPSAEGRELERQLTCLAIERLSEEKQVFVLERKKMQALVAEKEGQGLDDAPFWNGSYLMEGVLDRDGYSAENLTLHVRLAPPDRGAPVEFVITESRTNLAAVVESLAVKVTAALKLKPSRRAWNPAEEAEQFFQDATWAMRWKLFGQAQSASEAAWALGKHTPELASLRLRAYSEACLHREPIHSGNTDCVTIFAVPEADKLDPITRALEVFARGTDFFRTNATDLDWLKSGHRALRTAAGILESFYYAAEARFGREEVLERVRAASRRAADLLSRGAGTNSISLDRWSDCLEFSWLQWNEGGVWCDRPEAALPRMRETLANGFHPENLPRLIGWNWEDRLRVPRLQREFIQDLCAATNVNLRLEGRYLALLRAPVGEPGGWQPQQRELLAAMWENRDWIFRNVGNASLLPRVEELLRAKQGYQDPTVRFADEEFITLRHQLRREYLAQANSYDSLLFQKLFGPSPNPGPTADEARELLPLVEDFAQRANQKAHKSNWIVASFRSAAGLPVAKAPTAKPAGPALPSDAAVVGKFIPWRLARRGIDPGRVPEFSRGQLHDGRLWFLARYSPPKHELGAYQAAFVEVDPLRGVTQEIPFPEPRGFPGAFLVSGENLLASVTDKIECYSFRDRTWNTLPIALEGAAEILEMKGHRYLATKESLLELKPDLRSADILASSRRQPPKHELDSLWGNRRLLVAGVNGKLGLIVTNRLWIYDPASGFLTNSPAVPVPGNYTIASFSWDDGWLVSLTGQSMLPRHLLAFSENATNFESMVQQRVVYQGRRFGPALVKQLSPPKWDWPEDFPMEETLLAVEGRALWALNPRKFSNSDFPGEADEPMTFTDDRDATLFRFESEFRLPLALRVRFEANDQGINPFLAREAGFSRGSWVKPNMQFWLPTPQGLVLAVPKAVGHWLIAQSILETKLAAQRTGRRAKASATGLPSPMAEVSSVVGLPPTNRAPVKP